MGNKLLGLGFVLKAVERLSGKLKKIETQMGAVNATAAAPWREFAGNLPMAEGAIAAGAIAFSLEEAIGKVGKLEGQMARLARTIGNVPDKARRLDQPEKFVKEQSIASGYDVNQLTKSLCQGLSGFLNMTRAMAVSVEAAKQGRDKSGDLGDTTSLAALLAGGLSGESAGEGFLEIITQMSRASQRLGFDAFAEPNRQGTSLLNTPPGIHWQFSDISKHKDFVAAFGTAFGARAGDAFIGSVLAPVTGAIRSGGAALIPPTFEVGVNLNPLKTLAERLVERSEQASLRAGLKTFAFGIWSGVAWPIRAAKHQGVILDHLKMHSSAKLGPLREPHSVRIVETIVQAIKPAPMLAGIRRMAPVAVVTMPMMIGGAAVPAAGAISSPFRGAAFADSLATASQARLMSGAVVLNYAPRVEVHAPGGNAATIEKAVMETLERNRREVYRMLEQVAGRRERTRF